MLVPKNSHLGIDLDIFGSETIAHRLESCNFVVLLLLAAQQHVDFVLHPIEVIHELGQTEGFRALLL